MCVLGGFWRTPTSRHQMMLVKSLPISFDEVLTPNFFFFNIHPELKLAIGVFLCGVT